jgi:hypothetical protein
MQFIDPPLATAESIGPKPFCIRCTVAASSSQKLWLSRVVKRSSAPPRDIPATSGPAGGAPREAIGGKAPPAIGSLTGPLLPSGA